MGKPAKKTRYLSGGRFLIVVLYIATADNMRCAINIELILIPRICIIHVKLRDVVGDFGNGLVQHGPEKHLTTKYL